MSIHNKELWEPKFEPGHVTIFRGWETEVIFYQEKEQAIREEGAGEGLGDILAMDGKLKEEWD